MVAAPRSHLARRSDRTRSQNGSCLAEPIIITFYSIVLWFRLLKDGLRLQPFSPFTTTDSIKTFSTCGNRSVTLAKNGPSLSGRLFGTPARSERLFDLPPEFWLKSFSSDAGLGSPVAILCTAPFGLTGIERTKEISSGTCTSPIGNVTASPS